jgi:hypothetical protein
VKKLDILLSRPSWRRLEFTTIPKGTLAQYQIFGGEIEDIG